MTAKKVYLLVMAIVSIQIKKVIEEGGHNPVNENQQ